MRPERTRLNDDGTFKLRKPLPQKWWIYTDKRPKLYSKTAVLSRVLVLTRHTKMIMPAWVHGQQVYSDATVVFTYDTDEHFGLLSSAFHWWWAVTHSSTIGKGTRYTPSDCFETFSPTRNCPRTSPIAALGSMPCVEPSCSIGNSA